MDSRRNREYKITIGNQELSIKVIDVPDSEGYLYNEGEYEDFWVEGLTRNTGILSKNEYNMEIIGGPDTTEDARRSYVTDEPISLDGYSSLEVSWEVFGSSSFDVWRVLMHIADSKGVDQNNAITVAGQYEPTNRTTASADISSYSGNFYVSIEAFDGDSGERENRVNVYQIQLIE